MQDERLFCFNYYRPKQISSKSELQSFSGPFNILNEYCFAFGKSCLQCNENRNSDDFP